METTFVARPCPSRAVPDALFLRCGSAAFALGGLTMFTGRRARRQQTASFPLIHHHRGTTAVALFTRFADVAPLSCRARRRPAFRLLLLPPAAELSTRDSNSTTPTYCLLCYRRHLFFHSAPIASLFTTRFLLHLIHPPMRSATDAHIPTETLMNTSCVPSTVTTVRHSAIPAIVRRPRQRCPLFVNNALPHTSQAGTLEPRPPRSISTRPRSLHLPQTDLRRWLQGLPGCSGYSLRMTRRYTALASMRPIVWRRYALPSIGPHMLTRRCCLVRVLIPRTPTALDRCLQTDSRSLAVPTSGRLLNLYVDVICTSFFLLPCSHYYRFHLD